MRSAYYRSAPDGSDLRRRRAIALAAVLAIHLLLVLGLLNLARVRALLPKQVAEMSVFSVLPDPARKAPAASHKSPVSRQGGGAPGPKAPPTPKTRSKPGEIRLPSVLGVDFDLKKVAPAPTVVAGGAGTTTGTDRGPTYGPTLGPTTAPGGQPLYGAEWYVEPTHAQIATYLPATGTPDGSWAMVACRTIDHYRVEDCTELEENPRGSGLARALREASWQFRIRPPRIGGTPQVGTWVRVRIDFTQEGIKEPR